MRGRVPIFCVLSLLFAAVGVGSALSAEVPNILWLTSEDHGPHLGCYGDKSAKTPHLDALASKSLRYLHCWSNAPVCAPARTTLITGMYPPSIGAEHMRSQVALPTSVKLYPQHLREAGYYCTNNSKEDYNLDKVGKVWDESSNKAHYKNRPAGKPFFAVFNATQSHESQLRGKPAAPQHDPSKVRVPAYHPDTPEVRHEWAHYHDNITKVDEIAGKHLKELQDAGLAEETIVFYYADHGSGMPRSKRVPCNSGLHVPLLVHFPKKWEHLAPPEYKAGGTSSRLVSFVDFSATLLSLANRPTPGNMQGRAFAGKYLAPAPNFMHGFRGRMDERYDCVRSVSDGRFVYLRNYMPHVPWGQHVSYMFQTKTTQVWKQLYDTGKATPAQSYFWQKKTPEELYDLQSDPDEVKNLAGSKEHQETIAKFRQAHREHMLSVRDVGIFPEAEMHRRASGKTCYELGQGMNQATYQRLLDTAQAASSLAEDALPTLAGQLKDADPAVRYWAALGLLMRGEPAVTKHEALLVLALKDENPSVVVPVAQGLAQFSKQAATKQEAQATLLKLADASKNSIYVSMASLNALDNLTGSSRVSLSELQKLPKDSTSKDRGAMGIERLMNHLLSTTK